MHRYLLLLPMLSACTTTLYRPRPATGPFDVQAAEESARCLALDERQRQEGTWALLAGVLAGATGTGGAAAGALQGDKAAVASLATASGLLAGVGGVLVWRREDTLAGMAAQGCVRVPGRLPEQ